ncbi:hypothetical protein BDZ91DRAFT_803031 [Kalaharituber pfeilii]|nr:hypothetical protein BDZ91DRAFT_803031 [Kalaharituber pfeilii]
MLKVKLIIKALLLPILNSVSTCILIIFSTTCFSSLTSTFIKTLSSTSMASTKTQDRQILADIICTQPTEKTKYQHETSTLISTQNPPFEPLPIDRFFDEAYQATMAARSDNDAEMDEMAWYVSDSKFLQTID